MVDHRIDGIAVVMGAGPTTTDDYHYRSGGCGRDGRYDRYNRSDPEDRDRRDRDDRWGYAERDRDRRGRGRDSPAPRSTSPRRRGGGSELSKVELEKAREQHAKIDSEYAAFLQQKKDKDEEFRLRRQGEWLAASLKGTLESHFASHKTGPDRPGTPTQSRTSGPASEDNGEPDKPPPDQLSRAELGWLQSVLGKSARPEEGMDVRGATTVLEKALSNKGVVAQAHKVIHAHYPRRTPPSSKAAKAQWVMAVIRGNKI